MKQLLGGKNGIKVILSKDVENASADPTKRKPLNKKWIKSHLLN